MHLWLLTTPKFTPTVDSLDVLPCLSHRYIIIYIHGSSYAVIAAQKHSGISPELKSRDEVSEYLVPYTTLINYRSDNMSLPCRCIPSASVRRFMLTTCGGRSGSIGSAGNEMSRRTSKAECETLGGG